VCAFQIFESTSSCSKFVESTCINRRVGFSLKYCSLLRSGEMHGQMHPQMPSFGFFQSCRSVMPFPLQSFFLSSKLSSGNRFAVTKQREACAKKRKITEPAKWTSRISRSAAQPTNIAGVSRTPVSGPVDAPVYCFLTEVYRSKANGTCFT